MGERMNYPKLLSLYVSYVCNASCVHCPYTNSDIREKKEKKFMSLKTFRKIVDQSIDKDCTLLISGGGEPMLNPDILDMVDYAKQAKLDVRLFTNGSLINTPIVFRLVNAGLNSIEFSVDAHDRETYEKIRTGLDYKKLKLTIGTTKRYRDHSGEKTKIIISIVNHKGVDIEKAKEEWGLYCDYILIRKYLSWGDNSNVPDLSGDKEIYTNPAETPCPFPFERMNIDTNGDILICGYDIRGKVKIGNLRKDRIEDVWNGSEMTSVRNYHSSGRGDLLNLCKDCQDWKYRSWEHNYWKVKDKLSK